MSVSHATAVRNAVADTVVDLVDAGAGAGKLKIRDGSTVLATITLADPAFGSASGGAALMSGLPKSDTSADAAGDADNFQVTDSNDTVVFSGSVSGDGGGGDIELDNVSIEVGQTVTVTAFSYVAPV